MKHAALPQLETQEISQLDLFELLSFCEIWHQAILASNLAPEAKKHLLQSNDELKLQCEARLK